MKVYELLDALNKMPRDVTITWIVAGEIYDDNGATVNLVLNHDGYTSAYIHIKVKE